MTLMDLKKQLRSEIRALKECLRDLRHENAGIDPFSGHYAQTGKYEMKIMIEGQIEHLKMFLDRLYQVKRMK